MSPQSPTVLHISTSHQASDVRIYHKECRSLAQAGYNVTLAAGPKYPTREEVKILPLSQVPKSQSKRLASGMYRGWVTSLLVQYDILHIHDLELLPAGIWAARSGKAVIWDAHEDYVRRFSGDWEHTSSSWKAPLVDRPMSALLKRMDALAAGVIVTTERDALTYSNPRTVIVANEARLEDYADVRPVATSRRALFVGTPTAFQMFDEVVEAVAGIPELTLAVAGLNADAPEARAAATTLGSRLECLGWLNREQLGEAMTSSLIGFATIADLPEGTANSSNKVFEFGAAGLPTVMTPTPMNLSHGRSGGHVYMADDFTAAAIGAALQAAVDDPEVWTAKSARGRDWAAEKGSWATSERRLLDLYDLVTADLGR